MRELLLIAIVAVICCVALGRPLIGLYGYVWFALLRPDVLAWSYGTYPYSLALAVATGIGILRHFGSLRRILTNPICLLLLALQIPLVFSILVAQVPEEAWAAYTQFLRVIAMALLIPALVDTEPKLRRLVLLMGVSLGFLGTKFGLYGIINGGVRFAQGYGGMLSDNNDIALALVTAIPPMWYLRGYVESKLWRGVLLGMVFCTMAGVIMTYSRGGAVTLAVILFLMVMRSKQRIGALVFLTLLVAPILWIVGASYQERMSTIADPQHEASSYSRIALAKAAFAMWQDYPILGVGFGGSNFARLVGSYTDTKSDSVAHNTYVQMLVDSGIFAMIIYLALLWGTIGWLQFSIRRTRRYAPEFVALPYAIQSSLIAFAVGSTFLSRVHFDVLYFYLMAAASWWMVRHSCVRSEMALEVQLPEAGLPSHDSLPVYADQRIDRESPSPA